MAPTKKPNITVTDRRIADRLRNPFGSPSTAIQLKTPGMECRWFNAAIMTDKIWRAKHSGWDPVTPDMLADKDQVGGFVVSADGYVCRGEKQQEVLMFMSKENRDAIQQAKTEANIRNMRMGRQKDEVAQAAAERFGDQAGEFLAKAKMVGTVTDQYERIHRENQVED